MPDLSATDIPNTAAALDEERCWQAVRERDRRLDGAFYLAVKTTRIFCRPGCGARPPLRKNGVFYRTAGEAMAAGFRPCKRCRPTEIAENTARVGEVCAFIRAHADSGEKLGLAELAELSGLSPGHLQRIFRATLGITPRQYVEACRLGLLKQQLRAGESVTDAIYAAGFGAASRLYEKVDSRLGMTPRQYGQGGKGQSISYALIDSPVGRLLLAATDRGLCSVQLGDDDDVLLAGLRSEFPQAAIAPAATPGSPALELWREALERHLENQEPLPDLPLDVRASAFQQQVWSYLRTIPRGEVRTYQQVAQAIGRPNAMRAVGTACGKNPTALVVPCHRVIRGDGASGGYRWGEDRKRRILAAEQSARQ